MNDITLYAYDCVQAQLSLSVIYKPPPGAEAGLQGGGISGLDEQATDAGRSYCRKNP